MKKLLLMLFFLPVWLTSTGQDIIISGGGAGHFMTGPAFILNKNVTDYLKKPTVLGPSYDGVPLAMQIGGEGYAMINKFIIGGGGFALAGFESNAGHGTVTIGGAGGYFKSGYRFWTRKASFMTVNTGVGAFGCSVDLENMTDENGIAFNKTNPIAVGEKRSYSFGGALFDLSLGFKSMAMGSMDENGFGGFLLGVDAGCMLNVPVGEWKADNENTIQGPPGPGLVTIPFIRLTLGGGGFGYRK
jgi:hypothetical protein